MRGKNTFSSRIHQDINQCVRAASVWQLPWKSTMSSPQNHKMSHQLSAVAVPLFPSLADPTEIKLSWALLHTQWLHLPKTAGTQSSLMRSWENTRWVKGCHPVPCYWKTQAMCVSEQSITCDFSNCVWPCTIITTISGGVDVNYLSLNTKHNEMMRFYFQTVLPWTLNIIQLIKKKSV